MGLEKLKGYEEWMRSERSDIFNELIYDYIHEYKCGLAEDNVVMVMNDDTRYIVPRRIQYNDLIKLLKENEIEIQKIKEIREIH